MIAHKLDRNEKLVTITYDSLDTLFKREDFITTTLQNNLNRSGNKEYIRSSYIAMNEVKNKVRYMLNFILAPTENN